MEIIPKPIVRVPLWQNILFYCSIVLVLAAVLSIFILGNLRHRALQELDDLQAAIIQKRGSLGRLEREILAEQKKINDFSSLIDKHKNSVNFFSILEKLTHPKVQFTDLSLSFKENKAGLAGIAESFLVLDQQVLIFKEAKEIKNVNLSKVSPGKEGGASFTLSLLFNQEIFKAELEPVVDESESLPISETEPIPVETITETSTSTNATSSS